MRKAAIYVKNKLAGYLIEHDNSEYSVEYIDDYHGHPISLTMPLSQKIYPFKTFPAFFDGLLPEGPQLEGLLKQAKLDRHDYFGQLITVGNDLVGCVTVREDND